MTDKTAQLVVEGLARAASEPAGLPLHGTRTVPGLFAGTAAGKRAAQECKQAGYLTLVRTETSGKKRQEICSITDKGIAFLLRRMGRPPATSSNGRWKHEAFCFLKERQLSRGQEDCPLPELFQRVQQAEPELTIGRFHDGLRQLHEGGEIYLHPWTGPLHEIPYPALALLVGHAVVYYVSPRNA